MFKTATNTEPVGANVCWAAVWMCWSALILPVMKIKFLFEVK